MVQIVNQPKFLTEENYVIELNNYLSRAKKVEGLVSVVTLGSVGAPGLSDLDVICVVEDDSRANDLYPLRVSKKDHERGIFIHPPIIIPKSLFKEIDYIFPVSNLVDCYGLSLASEKSTLARDVEKSLSLVYLMDFTFSRLLQHSVVRANNIVEKRNWLTRLWSLTHTQRLCNDVGLVLKPSWESLLSEIRDVRKKWNSGVECSDEKFWNLYQRLFCVHLQLLPEIFKKELEFLELNKPSLDLRFGNKNKRIFCKSSVKFPLPINHYTKYWSSVLKINYQTLFSPIEYSLRLAHYGFSTSADLTLSDNSYGQILKKRGALVRKYNEFLDNAGITFSLRGNLGLPVKNESFIFDLIHEAFWFIQRYKK
tara:strand:+ start:90 stop:1190 length:1101 start_codon:yes stop_codon:yes gene_type:complete